METHYVYRITDIENNMHYYGCRSCVGSPENDLGVKYFSSSKYPQFIYRQRETPQHFKYKIIREFRTREDALLFEVRLHLKFDVANNPAFFNKARQTSSGFYYSGKGQKFTDEHRRKIATKSRNKSEQTREKIRERVKADWANMSEERRKRKIEAMSRGHIGHVEPEWKRKQHSERMSGAGNSRAKIIYIYDSFGELRHICNGNFKETCITHGLPHTSLRKSHVTGGKPICKTQRSRKEAEKRGWIDYEGWFAMDVTLHPSSKPTS